MSNNIAVKVDHVSKFFRLPTEATQSLRTSLVNRFKGIKGYKEQHVLKDISFEVEKGDFYGIVGRNGSGKSTLLKIISEIYIPEKGKVTIDGKLVSFIELGVGFNPELTGRENVYMNGAMLGFGIAPARLIRSRMTPTTISPTTIRFLPRSLGTIMLMIWAPPLRVAAPHGAIHRMKR